MFSGKNTYVHAEVNITKYWSEFLFSDDSKIKEEKHPQQDAETGVSCLW